MTANALLPLTCAVALGACSLEHADDNAASNTDHDMTARLDYFELPATDAAAVAATRDFYAEAFGWTFTDFGPDYAATTSGDTDVGISAAPDEDRIEVPLPVIRVADLEAALDQVERAGGRIVRPIFAYPGGRRFHAVDPAGNEFAVYKPDDETGAE